MRVFIALVFSINLLGAQKVVKKSIINPEITTINVDANNCFELAIETTDNDEMVLEATIGGEYEKDLVLTSKQEGRTLQVNSGFQPIFKKPNDKLSAHKVVSIALKIYMPKNRSVNVFGGSCNVTVTGNYRKLKITVNEGNCTLNDVSESVMVKTRSGNISLYTKGAYVKAKSKYGNVQSDKIPNSEDRFDLTSVTGNISIIKTE